MWVPIRMIQIKEMDILSSDAQSLIALLDQELATEYAPEHRHGVQPDEFHNRGGVFVVAYAQQKPVACGALRPIDAGTVELKRMFVRMTHRGKGAARQVLNFLEEKARELAFSTIRLETGDRQTAAMRLYDAAGYEKIAPFGEYAASSRSVCFEKKL